MMLERLRNSSILQTHLFRVGSKDLNMQQQSSARLGGISAASKPSEEVNRLYRAEEGCCDVGYRWTVGNVDHFIGMF